MTYSLKYLLLPLSVILIYLLGNQISVLLSKILWNSSSLVMRFL